MTKKIVLGLMSGTSADGLTICAITPRPFRLLHFKNYPYTPALQQKLLRAFSYKAAQLSELNYELGKLYAQRVARFMREFAIKPQDILCIGSHGQTIYHGPNDQTPNTLQIAEPSFMAAQIGCPVVSDFRAKDIALGGQGAPLIPFFDEYFYGRKTPVMLLNIGGVSNLSVVGKGIKTVGFDIGPGNSLTDLICQQYFKQPFDTNGRLAAQGTPDKQLIKQLLTQPFFRQKPPKSLDKNAFGVAYLKRYFKQKNPHDLLASATYFTASAIAQAVTEFVPLNAQKKLIVSGGGAYNKTLLKMLIARLPGTTVETSQQTGIPPQAKESAAFALFAYLALRKKNNHCASATGAAENTILGKITL